MPLRLAGAHTSGLPPISLTALAVTGEPGDRRLVCLDTSSTVHSFRWPPAAGRAPAISACHRHCSTQLPASDLSKASASTLLPNAEVRARSRMT